MAFDFKKEYKEFYQPPKTPTIIDVPTMNYLAVRGTGDPNEENGAYQEAITLLYGVAYTLKMSYKGDYQIAGFFEYVVPPLEGFWWQEGIKGVDYQNKQSFQFISLIRLPDFVTEKDVQWAIETATKKKGIDYSKVFFLPYEEGVCVQCMHLGPYDDEPETIERMHQFMETEGYKLDISDTRYHQEIYLSDPRKSKPEKMKTVLRHPIKKNHP